MIEETQKLIDSYIDWLKKKIKLEDINGICEITTPFLDRHNDYIQIYLKRINEGLVLSDDGNTLKDLELSGVDLNSEKRKTIINSILNGFGIKRKGKELLVEARPSNFPQKKHNLIQAILAIGDVFMTSREMVAGIFKEDVKQYLKIHKVRFTPSVKFSGKSGLDHYFDFVIPSSDIKPERILRTINRTERQNIISLIFAWTDIKEVRETHPVVYAILNDQEKKIREEFISALKEYEIIPLIWSKREEYIEELVA